MITKKDVLALCNEPSQAFVERWINSEEQADIHYLGIERTEDNRSRKEFTLIYSQFDRYNNKEIISIAVLSDAGTQGAACFFGGLSHFARVQANKRFHLSDSRKAWGLSNEDFRAYWQTVETIENKYLTMIKTKSA